MSIPPYTFIFRQNPGCNSGTGGGTRGNTGGNIGGNNGENTGGNTDGNTGGNTGGSGGFSPVGPRGCRCGSWTNVGSCSVTCGSGTQNQQLPCAGGGCPPTTPTRTISCNTNVVSKDNTSDSVISHLCLCTFKSQDYFAVVS